MWWQTTRRSGHKLPKNYKAAQLYQHWRRLTCGIRYKTENQGVLVSILFLLPSCNLFDFHFYFHLMTILFLQFAKNNTSLGLCTDFSSILFFFLMIYWLERSLVLFWNLTFLALFNRICDFSLKSVSFSLNFADTLAIGPFCALLY